VGHDAHAEHSRGAERVLAILARAAAYADRVLIRRFHDATVGTPLAEGPAVVCHGDLSLCNTVFRGGVPVALIDFDNAAPGARLEISATRSSSG
jgi:aminoglycoside phosphotransferase (APT) family kinase protein